MKKIINSISYKEFAKEILKAIKDEPLFNDEILIPKIMTLSKMFQLNIASNNYKNIDSPTELQKKLRQIEELEFEKEFFKKQLKNYVDENTLKDCFQKLDEIKNEYFK